MIGNPYQQYQNNSILTASPTELTLMLYNGAIKFCNQAIEAIENHDLQNAHAKIIRAQDIVNELQVTLDKKYAVAKELDPMYTFIKELLIGANISKDVQKLKDATHLLRELKDVWEQVMKKHTA